MYRPYPGHHFILRHSLPDGKSTHHMRLPAVATLGSSSNELTSTSTTISCRLPFLSFGSFFLQSRQVWGLRESKEASATAFHASAYSGTYGS